MAVHVDESVPLHAFTKVEVLALTRSGALPEDVPLELVDGALVEVTREGPLHRELVLRLQRWLVPVWGEGFDVPASLMYELDGSESLVHPDVAVGRRSDTSRAVLAIEVSVTSRRFDLGRKALVFARSGLPELWVVDAPQRRVVVHRDPGPTGWATVTEHTGGVLTPASVPAPPLDLDALWRDLPEG